MNHINSLATQRYAALRAPTSADPASSPAAAMVRDFAQTVQQGENAAKAALVTDVDPHVYVKALAQTELAVEAAVTVRDKVVEAYQEILRMPV